MCSCPSLYSVEWLILDEADKLFEEGTNSFREQIAEVYTACSSLDVRHALFSATMGSGVEEFTKVHFESPVRVLVGLQYVLLVNDVCMYEHCIMLLVFLCIVYMLRCVHVCVCFVYVICIVLVIYAENEGVRTLIWLHVYVVEMQLLTL